MAISILGPLNQIINKTTDEVISSQITSKVAGVIGTLVSSSFEVVDDTLKKISDITKEEPHP